MSTKVLWNHGAKEPQAMYDAGVHPNPAFPPCKQLPPHDGVNRIEVVILALQEVAPAVHGEEHFQWWLLPQHLASQQPPPLTLFKANQGQCFSFPELHGQIVCGDGD